MATYPAALEQASRNDRHSRWYLRDLPKYGAGLFAITFMYVAIRLYQLGDRTRFDHASF